jgi:hypothetical protein
LTDLYESNDFKTIKGKFGSDTRGELTIIKKLGNNVILPLKVQLIIRILNFMTGTETISNHMTLLLELKKNIYKIQLIIQVLLVRHN